VHLFSSLIASFAVTTFMNPPDVLSTRMYNDGARQYASYRDCCVQTIRTDGVRALFKGWTAHYLRLGPHTILTFMIWEQLKKLT
jgi:solute carrier family 25 protein 34/35